MKLNKNKNYFSERFVYVHKAAIIMVKAYILSKIIKWRKMNIVFPGNSYAVGSVGSNLSNLQKEIGFFFQNQVHLRFTFFVIIPLSLIND